MSYVDVPRGPASAAQHSLGVAMLGGNPKSGRHVDGFYATPDDVTLALLERMPPTGPVWEPCCGDGAIGRILEAKGHEVVGTDLVDRGWGDHGGGHDVLRSTSLPCRDIVTNPPFEKAEEIIDHLMGLGPRYLAMLLKGSFWNAKRRSALFARHRPRAVLALSWRPDFARRKRPTMECLWTVWETPAPTITEFDILARPSRDDVARILAHGPVPRPMAA